MGYDEPTPEKKQGSVQRIRGDGTLLRQMQTGRTGSKETSFGLAGGG
jgi:hypothetical protein